MNRIIKLTLRKKNVDPTIFLGSEHIQQVVPLNGGGAIIAVAGTDERFVVDEEAWEIARDMNQVVTVEAQIGVISQ